MNLNANLVALLAACLLSLSFFPSRFPLPLPPRPSLFPLPPLSSTPEDWGFFCADEQRNLSSLPFLLFWVDGYIVPPLYFVPQFEVREAGSLATATTDVLSSTGWRGAALRPVGASAFARQSSFPLPLFCQPVVFCCGCFLVTPSCLLIPFQVLPCAPPHVPACFVDGLSAFTFVS